jgi:hypothetical protein
MISRSNCAIEPTRRRAGVDPHVEDLERDALALQQSADLDQVRDRPRQPGQRGDDQHIAVPHIVERRLELGAIGNRADLLGEHLGDAFTLQRLALRLEPRLLVPRRGSCISDDRHLPWFPIT